MDCNRTKVQLDQNLRYLRWGIWYIFAGDSKQTNSQINESHRKYILTKCNQMRWIDIPFVVAARVRSNSPLTSCWCTNKADIMTRYPGEDTVPLWKGQLAQQVSLALEQWSVCFLLSISGTNKHCLKVKFVFKYHYFQTTYAHKYYGTTHLIVCRSPRSNSVN